MEITVRIYTPLNERLDVVSVETGIPKSALILYAVNFYLRAYKKVEGLTYYDPNGKDMMSSSQGTVRFTLRVPDHINELIENKAKEANVSKNKLINNCIRLLDMLHWKQYSRIAIKTNEDSGMPVD